MSTIATTKSMQLLKFGRSSQGKLQLREAQIPQAGPDQIVIKIQASSLNPHDWKYYEALRRIYHLPAPLPALTLGHDLSGTVVSVGAKVKRFQVGDDVFAMSLKTGAFGQYLAVAAGQAAPKPRNLPHAEAASLPMAALTAWQALLLASLQDGERVLVLGGSGGVGSQAIQIAKAKGAHVAAVCSTSNVALVSSWGAEQAFDYKKIDVLESGQQFDVVLDTVGTLTPTSVKKILAPGGRFVSTVPNAAIILATLLSYIPGITLHATRTLIALPIGRHLEEIARLVEDGKVRPVIDREFPLEDIDSAIAYSKTGRTRGKIVLSIR